jgi:branched-chain amino acid transport system ATP-binding protein
MLVVQNIRKHFGGLTALDSGSFEVSQGTLTAVIGPNGAGKTTLFNIVSGLLPPTAGTITFQGVDVTGWPPHRIARAGLSRTFQNIQLFPALNALENVIAARCCRTHSNLLEALLFLPRDRLERRRSREIAEELLAWVGIAAQRFLMPRELPYGDQRRLEIARALATEPALLMLDEPTAGMSHLEAQELMGLVGRLKERGTTILLIEHNMHLVMSHSDKIVVLNFGKRIAEGSATAIQTNPEVIEAYLGVET